MSAKPVVVLTQSALDTIHTETFLRTDGSETGGLLLGRADPDDVTTVLIAGGPGPNAIHEPTRFLRDLQHAQALAGKAWRDHRAQWIGEWHTHPNGSAYPSEADLRSYLRHLADHELGFSQFLSLIVAVSRERPLGLVAWIVTPAHAVASAVEVLNDL